MHSKTVPEFVNETETQEIEICGLCETMKKDKEKVTSLHFRVLYCGMLTDKKLQEGVRLLFKNKKM